MFEIVYKDYKSSFAEKSFKLFKLFKLLFRLFKSFTVHHRNVKKLAIDINKVKH